MYLQNFIAPACQPWQSHIANHAWILGLHGKPSPVLGILPCGAHLTKAPSLSQPQFEKSENKVAIVGYSAGALGAFVFAEWLIHLPGLNFVRALYGECIDQAASCMS